MFGQIKKHKGQMSDSFLTAAFIVLSGGLQDAYTYSCRGEVFANAQTGNIVLLSAKLFRMQWQEALKYLVPVTAFLVGTVVAEAIHSKMKHFEKLHWRQIVLLCEIFILFFVAYIPEELNPAANAMVSFVCAMQVHSFHKVRGHAYASTMCIGNLRCGTEALCAYCHNHERPALYKALTYFAVIALFAVGAGIGSIATEYFGRYAIWISCFMLTVSFSVMFIREEITAK